MANKKLKGIIWPNLPNDTYLLDSGEVNYDPEETYREGSTGKALQNKAEVDGYYSNLTAGSAEQLLSTVTIEDEVPYLFRTSGGSIEIGDRETDCIVGGTVAWNQQIETRATQDVSNTSNGVTVTKKPNGSIVINGTATADMWLSDFYLSLPLVHVGGTAGHKIMYIYASKHSFKNRQVGSANAGYTVVNDFNAVIVSRPASSSTVDSPAQVQILNGDTFNNDVVYPCMFDLTQMFGSTIADYIYSLEQANVGAGVAWFKKLFPKPYYAYNAGELMSVKGLVSHDMVGFNVWDEEWEVGSFSSGGVPAAANNAIRSKNFCPCLPNTTYFMTCGKTDGGSNNRYYLGILQYDADFNYISICYNNNGTVTTNERARYFKICTNTSTVVYGPTYNNDICINLSWDGERDGEYEPYVKHSYPLDDSLTLRGIPKLDASNNLYYDGDVYESDGTVTRKYGVLAMDTVPSDWAVSSTNVFELTLRPAKFQNDFACLTDSPYIQIPRNADTTNLDMVFKAVGEGTASHLYFVNKSVTTISDFLATVSGKHLVYELATPTTETADPYTNPQIVDDFGTEEYVSTNIVPVGHKTQYMPNLRAKLEMAPNSPNGNGDYIVRQTNGMNEYVPLVIEDALPTMPSAVGTYKLTVTVTDGSDPVLSWEAE